MTGEKGLFVLFSLTMGEARGIVDDATCLVWEVDRPRGWCPLCFRRLAKVSDIRLFG